MNITSNTQQNIRAENTKKLNITKKEISLCLR